MAKRVTMQQRLVAFGLEAVGIELDAAIQTLQAIRDNRFPKNNSKPRKSRSDAGKSRPTPTPTSTPPASAAGEPSSSEK